MTYFNLVGAGDSPLRGGGLGSDLTGGKVDGAGQGRRNRGRVAFARGLPGTHTYSVQEAPSAERLFKAVRAGRVTEERAGTLAVLGRWGGLHDSKTRHAGIDFADVRGPRRRRPLRASRLLIQAAKRRDEGSVAGPSWEKTLSVWERLDTETPPTTTSAGNHLHPECSSWRVGWRGVSVRARAARASRPADADHDERGDPLEWVPAFAPMRAGRWMSFAF